MTHAVSIRYKLISLTELLEDIALLVEHIKLLCLSLLTLKELFFAILRHIVFSFQSFPELRIVRVSFPLLSKLLYVFVKQVAVIFLLKVIRHIVSLHTCLGAHNARKVWNSCFTARLEVHVLTLLTTAIVAVISACNVDIDLRCGEIDGPR